MADYQIWICGMPRYWVTGYGIVIQPGHAQISGTCAGHHNTLEAERMAAKAAFSRIPANSTCTVYSSFPPIIPWLRGLTSDDVPVQIAQAEIAPIGDLLQREAQNLAKLGCMIEVPIES